MAGSCSEYLNSLGEAKGGCVNKGLQDTSSCLSFPSGASQLSECSFEPLSAGSLHGHGCSACRCPDGPYLRSQRLSWELSREARMIEVNFLVVGMDSELNLRDMFGT